MKQFILAVFLSVLIYSCGSDDPVTPANSQWVQVSNGMGNTNISSLASGVNKIFAGGVHGGGVYISSDNGANWTFDSITNSYVRDIAVSGNYIYAGTNFYGLYWSTNSGINWSPTTINGFGYEIHRLAAEGSYIMAEWRFFYAPPYGEYFAFSTNYGQTWIDPGFGNNVLIGSLLIRGNNFFAAALPNKFYISTNYGTNWAQTTLSANVRSLGANANYIFAGTLYNGIYLSSDNGTNWTQTSLNNRNVYSLSVSGNNIFAGTEGFGVYVSNNNGLNWTQRNEGLGNDSIYSSCILNNYIFIGTNSRGVWRRPLVELAAIQTIPNEIPTHFSLSQNYPNPFNPTAIIEFAIPKTSFAKLIIYDITGREVQTLINEELKPGTYKADFDETNLTSGMYFYTLVVNDPSTGSGQRFTETKKMVLIK